MTNTPTVTKKKSRPKSSTASRAAVSTSRLVRAAPATPAMAPVDVGPLGKRVWTGGPLAVGALGCGGSADGSGGDAFGPLVVGVATVALPSVAVVVASATVAVCSTAPDVDVAADVVLVVAAAADVVAADVAAVAVVNAGVGVVVVDAVDVVVGAGVVDVVVVGAGVVVVDAVVVVVVDAGGVGASGPVDSFLRCPVPLGQSSCVPSEGPLRCSSVAFTTTTVSTTCKRLKTSIHH